VGFSQPRERRHRANNAGGDGKTDRLRRLRKTAGMRLEPRTAFPYDLRPEPVRREPSFAPARPWTTTSSAALGTAPSPAGSSRRARSSFRLSCLPPGGWCGWIMPEKLGRARPRRPGGGGSPGCRVRTRSPGPRVCTPQLGLVFRRRRTAAVRTGGRSPAGPGRRLIGQGHFHQRRGHGVPQRARLLLELREPQVVHRSFWPCSAS
jgi:hypothetical protein